MRSFRGRTVVVTGAALRGCTDSLRCELRHDRVPVWLCMLQLPAVNTPPFEVARSRLPNRPMPVSPALIPGHRGAHGLCYRIARARRIERMIRASRGRLWGGLAVVALTAVGASRWPP